MDDPITETRPGDALRRNGAHLVSAADPWSSFDKRHAARRDGQIFVDLAEPAPEEDLDRAVEAKKRDNLLVGETMLRIGLLGRGELAELQSAQAAACAGTVDSLLVASAIRSRLGEILLKARHITSSQLEAALALQRDQGGLLGEILLGQGWLDKDTLDAALALQATRAAR